MKAVTIVFGLMNRVRIVGCIKIFLVLILTFGMIAFMADISLLMAQGSSHDTHIDSEGKGPGIPQDETGCYICHGSQTPPIFADGEPLATTIACDSCHSPDGVFDGVQMAKANWHNMIYEPDGRTIKPGNEQWCKSCHDQSETGTNLIDNFEGYADNVDLRTVWKGKQDARRVTLMTNQTNPPVPNTLWGQFIRVKLKWDRSAKKKGRVKRTFSTPIDLSEKTFFCFYMKVKNRKRIKKVKVKLKKYPEGTWCVSSMKVSGTNNFNNKVWNLVSLPRSSFNDQTWGTIDEIQIIFTENKPTESLTTYIDIDEIGCDHTGPNVMGDGVTWGYDITGHKIICTHCHDPGSKHIDGNRLPIIQYIRYSDNPSNFRFRINDSLVPQNERLTYNMQLPFSEYVPGAEGSFALCYRCHSESAITTSAINEQQALDLNTNFREDGILFGGIERNLHYVHVVMEPWNTTCVLCHDPHGISNPAMTRRGMGNLVYVDENYCEITNQEDLHNPAINIAAVQTSDWDERFCFACHETGVQVIGQCSGGNNQYEYCNGWGCYDRTYKRLPHTGGMEFCDECRVCHGNDQSHTTHTSAEFNEKGPDPLACEYCHVVGGEEVYGIDSMIGLGVCDMCHSPGGAFDGLSDPAIGVEANWETGIYESDGKTLKPGKEAWCAGCHDGAPANSLSDGSGVDAPNVIGDNSTYGFYVTGHNMNCLSCHDTAKSHIDHDHRTYDVEVIDTNAVIINPYCDSYRLKEVDGQPAMNVPRPQYGGSTSPHLHWKDFALCFDCHNRYEVLGEEINDVSHTNFWNDDSSISNSHWLHLRMYSKHFDSDWDNTADSSESCITCHNVHGSPTGPMIRHGELISPEGTTSYIPALNFYYLIEGDGSATATFAPDLAAGSYYVYAWWNTHHNRSTYVKYIVNFDGDTNYVVFNQEQNGAQWNLLDEYTFAAGNAGSVVLSSEGADEYIMADAVGWDSDGVFEDDWDGDGILDPEIVMDDPAATYVGTWDVSKSSNPDFYGDGTTYHFAPIRDANTSVTESFGGNMWSNASLANNHVCRMCHSNVIYVREPGTVPRITIKSANPEQIFNDQTNPVLFTAYVTDPDGPGDINNVVIDLSSIGGSFSQDMYDDGSHGDVTPADGTYSYQFNVPAGIDGAPKSLTVTGTDTDSQTAQAFIELQVYEQGAIIVDNTDAVYAGNWIEYTSSNETYGISFHYHEAGSGTDTATWNVSVQTAGTYDVHAWWVTGSNRTANAEYTINHDGSPDTVYVSQLIKGGCWNYLGTYSFGVGDYSVVLSENADGFVIADAIKLAPAGGPSFYPFPISDNPQAEYLGPWGAAEGNSCFGADFYYHPVVSGTNTATWTLAVPAAGNYNIFAWWTESTNRAADAPYSINFEGGSETVTVCQQIRGGQWNYLGNYPFAAGNYSVVLSDGATDYNGGSSGPFVIADAIKFESGSAPVSPFPIADNWDATFDGPWRASSWEDPERGPDFHGLDYQYFTTSGTGTNKVTWTIAVPTPGAYNVYARWVEYSNRTPDAKYTINHSGGSDTVTVCQQIRGGLWNYLGNFNFDDTDYTVTLSDDITYIPGMTYTIADAIKFESGSAPEFPFPVADNWDATFVGPWRGGAWLDGGTFHGADYQYHPQSTETDTVTWTTKIPDEGIYSVYTRWSAYSNRSTSAPYTIYFEGGSDLVTVNQRLDGGRWMYLGSYPFNAGTYSVVLTNTPVGYVIADAVWWEKGIVVDNADANFTGTWAEATDTTDRFSTSYHYHEAGSGSDAAVWIPDIPATGDYSVYAWWSADTDRATDAEYTINYNGVPLSVTRDQQQNGGQWNSLGTFSFLAGTSGSVELGEAASGKTIADAIKWVPTF